MQPHFNLPCKSCSSQLLETGLLLSTEQGPFVCCDICRTLYYIDVGTNYEDKPVIVIQPTKFDPEEEFDIIRNAVKRTPLKDYLPPENSDETIINPHFNQDLKSIIDASVTPSELIRRLHKHD